MITQDDKTRIRTIGFRETGIGMPMTSQCWGCNRPRGQAGGAYLGKLKLFHCAECKQRKEAELAAKKKAAREAQAPAA